MIINVSVVGGALAVWISGTPRADIHVDLVDFTLYRDSRQLHSLALCLILTLLPFRP